MRDRIRRSPREVVRAASGRLSLNTDRKAFIRSDAVISASRYQEAEMADIYRVPRDSVEVIYNGIDLALYRPDGEVAGLPGVVEQDKVVLFVGRLVPKKGLQHLIAAFPAILGKVPDARCVVVGGTAIFDTFGPKLRHMVADAGLTDRFTWLQDVPESRLPSVYRRAGVAVFPSINYESLPTVAMEAMASGVPVIATNRWGTPEALGSAHPGLVAQAAPGAIAEAVTTMLLDVAASHSIVRDQLARIESFSLDTCTRRHLDLYARLAAGHDAAAAVR
jgi:spore coat protein SA